MAKRESLENDPAIADLRERIAKLETHVFWMKKTLDKIDRRTWMTLGSVVAFGIISIVLSLL